MNVDAAIIGASSSGLYAAELLSRAGQQVAVFERQLELNPARRTYIITPCLQKVLGYIPEPAILHRISVMKVVTPGSQVEIELLEPDLIVERNLLIQFFTQRASEAGVKIYKNHHFLGFASDGRKTKLRVRNHIGEILTVETRSVIGAEGVQSEVTKALGLKPPSSVPILQAEVELPSGWNPSVTQVWFNTDVTRFFFWLIPESEQHAVVGLVGNNSRGVRAILQSFLTKHNFHPLSYQAGQVAMHHPKLRTWDRVGSVPVLLIGDAAGQVKVTTVGGTVTGFWGAQAAARSLLRGTSYSHELRALKQELNLHWFIRRLLDRLDNQGYDRLVRYINPALLKFFGSRNRDEMSGAIWQLLLRQPRLLALGLPILFRQLSHNSPAKIVKLLK